jgi:hypothetical protein
MKPTSDGLESSALKFLACCSINATRASTLLFFSSFIKIFYFCTKDRARWMTPVGLSEKSFLMHILFWDFQIVQASCKIRKTSLKIDTKAANLKLVQWEIWDSHSIPRPHYKRPTQIQQGGIWKADDPRVLPAHKAHKDLPFQFLVFSCCAVWILSWKVCHKKILIFSSTLHFQIFFARLLGIPPLVRKL